jgi:uncharacterized membrane protein HdeD (DUF308 family)
MVTTTGTRNVSDENTVFGEVSRNWAWILALGILFIILGIIGLGMLFGLTMASVFFFGILLVVGGGAQLADAFKCKGWKGILWHLLMAVLYVICGGIVIINPVGASMVLTMVLAGVLIAVGLVRIGMAIQMRSHGSWLWPFLGGIITILLGVSILAQWPVSGLWVIGLFVAVELIVNGWTYLFVALAARKAGKASSASRQSA